MRHPDNLTMAPFSPHYGEGVVEWIDVYGYGIPLTWGDVPAEYDAMRNNVAAIEFSMLLKYDIEGPGAIETANRLVSRDVSKLKPRQIAYGVITSHEGKMVDDCTIFLHSQDHVRLMLANPKAGEYLNELAVNSTVTERRAEFAQLSLQGPKSRALIQSLTDTDMSDEALPYYRFVTDQQIAGIPVQISRIGYSGELGYELLIPVDKAGNLWATLSESGKNFGLMPVGGAVVMTCRIESGLVMGEVEFNQDTTPYECRLGWTVDLDKFDFQGRAALEALKEKPRTRIVTVVGAAKEADISGLELTVDSTAVGVITMALPSFALEGKTLGFASVNADKAKVGTELEVVGQDGFTVVIVKTPVYDPDKIRVRS